MSLLATLVLAAATARVEAIGLVTVDSQLAVRVALSGQPGMVTVHRDAGAAWVSVADAALGRSFSGGQRFSWNPTYGVDPALLVGPARLDRLEVVAGPSDVSVLLHVPPEVSIDVRRDRRGLLLVFRQAPPAAPAAQVAAAPRPAAPPPEPSLPAPEAPTPEAEAPPLVVETPPVEPEAAPARPAPEPSVPEVAAPPAPPATAEAAPPPSAGPGTLELAKRLFPGAAAPLPEPGSAPQASVGELYGRLFPGGAPQTAPDTVVVRAVEPAGPDQGVVAGPFTIQAGIDARFVDADTFVETSGIPVRDRYLEVAPRILADAPLSDGSLRLGYLPTLRAFATFNEVNNSSHRLNAEIVLPLGPSVRVRARDSFVSGVLDTREVDPGGEYFFDLGRFHRNTLDGGASILAGPRFTVELGGSLTSIRFQEEASFFDYDTRMASAGLGYELTPNLKAILAYVYDQVPAPEGRPEAESRAHSGQVTLAGDILPLLSGSLTLGYRSQDSPRAAAGGTRYSGLAMGGTLTRQLGPESSFTLYVNRSTPVSAFEENAFYVTTGLQGALRVPLPFEVQLQSGLGYQWNDYRTVAEEIGRPREDRILALYVGLRRPVRRQVFLSASYRREERRSNLDRFDTTTDGFFLQLEWDIFGSPPR